MMLSDPKIQELVRIHKKYKIDGEEVINEPRRCLLPKGYATRVWERCCNGFMGSKKSKESY